MFDGIIGKNGDRMIQRDPTAEKRRRDRMNLPPRFGLGDLPPGVV